MGIRTAIPHTADLAGHLSVQPGLYQEHLLATYTPRYQSLVSAWTVIMTDQDDTYKSIADPRVNRSLGSDTQVDQP